MADQVAETRSGIPQIELPPLPFREVPGTYSTLDSRVYLSADRYEEIIPEELRTEYRTLFHEKARGEEDFREFCWVLMAAAQFTHHAQHAMGKLPDHLVVGKPIASLGDQFFIQ